GFANARAWANSASAIASGYMGGRFNPPSTSALSLSRTGNNASTVCSTRPIWSMRGMRMSTSISHSAATVLGLVPPLIKPTLSVMPSLRSISFSSTAIWRAISLMALRPLLELAAGVRCDAMGAHDIAGHALAADDDLAAITRGLDDECGAGLAPFL